VLPNDEERCSIFEIHLKNAANLIMQLIPSNY